MLESVSRQVSYNLKKKFQPYAPKTAKQRLSIVVLF